MMHAAGGHYSDRSRNAATPRLHVASGRTARVAMELDIPQGKRCLMSLSSLIMYRTCYREDRGQSLERHRGYSSIASASRCDRGGPFRFHPPFSFSLSLSSSIFGDLFVGNPRQVTPEDIEPSGRSPLRHRKGMLPLLLLDVEDH